MDTVYLATLENGVQASILQDVLRNAGIESFTKNEILSSVLNIPGFEIEVDVLEKDHARAYEIFKEAFPYLVDKDADKD